MWRKINKFVYSQVILSTIVLVAFFNSALTITGILAIPRDLELTQKLVIFTMYQLVLFATAIFLMRKMQIFNNFQKAAVPRYGLE